MTKSLFEPVAAIRALPGALKNSPPSERSTGLPELPDAISRLTLLNWATSTLVSVSVPSRPTTESATWTCPALKVSE